LIDQGRIVSKAPTNALIVDIDTQAIQFSANRPQYNHVGEASILAAGVWALSAVNATAAGVLTTGVASADAYTWFKSEFASGATPQTEIIITTSITDDTRYLARNTSVYYVADTDRSLYEGLPTIRVKGAE